MINSIAISNYLCPPRNTMQRYKRFVINERKVRFFCERFLFLGALRALQNSANRESLMMAYNIGRVALRHEDYGLRARRLREEGLELPSPF